LDVRTERRATDEQQSESAEIELVKERVCREQCRDRRRHRGVGHPVLGEQRQELDWIEPGLRHDRRALRQGRD
jgi:hypothetical protein